MIFDNEFSYWYGLGLLYLAMLTWQDYKNNRMVDDRMNWVMTGVTISLVSHVYSTLLYKIVLMFIVMFIGKFALKLKVMGKADLNTFLWIFTGLGLINPVRMFVYLIIISLLTVIYLFIKNIIFKYKHPVQYYGVILLSFILMILYEFLLSLTG